MLTNFTKDETRQFIRRCKSRLVAKKRPFSRTNEKISKELILCEMNAENRIPRMRTVKQCIAYIKAADPETAITEFCIRQLVKSGAVISYGAGSKRLVSLDSLLETLSVDTKTKMEKKDVKFASHTEVRQALVRMQKCGGAPIMPLSLFPLFYRLFTEEERTQPHPFIRARSYAYTFSAICNEYFVIYRNSRFPQTEFFISEERWSKYNILPEIREKGIEFLQRIALIICAEKVIPPDNKIERTFKIDSKQLSSIAQCVEEIYAEAQSAKYPF